GELAHARSLGHGEKIGRFEIAVGVIAERLLDPRGRHLVIDGDGDFLINQRKWRQFLLDRNQQAGRSRGASDREQHSQRNEYTTHGNPLSSWETMSSAYKTMRPPQWMGSAPPFGRNVV